MGLIEFLAVNVMRIPSVVDVVVVVVVVAVIIVLT